MNYFDKYINNRILYNTILKRRFKFNKQNEKRISSFMNVNKSFLIQILKLYLLKTLYINLI